MTDRDGKYAIHKAAQEGRINEVESLLNANPRLATRRDEDDRLPVHWALSNKHQDIVELLVEQKSFDPEVKDGSGWTPLMIASSLKEGEGLVQMLLHKGADVNAKKSSVLSCSYDVCRMRDTANLSSVPDSSGQTALHFCASKNNLEVAKTLLAQKATARVKDKRGTLPLHRAAAVGSVPMVQLLLDANSPVNATDMSGLTALHHCIAEGHGDVALVLLKAGAETDKRDVDDNLPIDVAPDDKVRDFVRLAAEREGIELQ